MAADIGRKYDTVLAWKLRGRIPEDAWDAVAEAAEGVGLSVSAELIRKLNAPVGKRGRPVKAHRAKGKST